MHYAAIADYLEKLQGENFKLSLDNIGRIVENLPFATGAVKYVQVAGTNGKGSTAHFIAAILRAAGWRVGLFSSPHLQDVRERISLNGRPISQRDFAAAVSAVDAIGRTLLRRRLILNQPTFFETIFLAALFHFNASRADWAVLEVGLGGRLDATSTVLPEIAVITNIAKDHTQILGRTLTAIAREKAGICKPRVPLVSGCPRSSAAGRVIAKAARDSKAPLHEVFPPGAGLQVEKKGRRTLCRYRSGKRAYEFRVLLNGRHQAVNAAVAVKTVEVLRERGCTIPEAALARGIKNMFIPARIESMGGRPPVILDGGHNPEGIRVLVEFLHEEGIRDFALIFGVMADKNYPAMARQLAPLAAHVILTVPPGPRALAAEKLLPFFRGSDCRVEGDFSRALAIAKKFKRIIIICGSLYLAGAMRTAMGRNIYGR